MANEFGIVRVGLACPPVSLANPKKNAETMLTTLSETRELGLDLIAFPELFITGYSCGDLFQQKILHDNVIKAIEYLIEQTRQLNELIIFGAPLIVNNKIYNLAIAMQCGRILGVVPKRKLPNYREFYEKRWFVDGYEIITDELTLFNQNIPIGTDILFKDKNNENFVVGIEICEDLWIPSPPSGDMAMAGATIIINPSASNWVIAKRAYRRQLVQHQSAVCISSYLYVSSGAGESTTDTVYDGHCIIANNGILVAESPPQMQFKTHVVTSEIDLDYLQNDRMIQTSFSAYYTQLDYRYITFNSPVWHSQLDVPPSATPFIPYDFANRRERCQEILNIQSTALLHRYKSSQVDNLIIGLSGGLDSTLALLVILTMFKNLDKDFSHCIPITMPGPGTGGKTLANVKELCTVLGLELVVIPIEEHCNLHLKEIGHSSETFDVTYENVQARIRTMILMNIANKQNGLVIGTGDMSELALGWTTYNGDHMSMYSVNSGVPKTLVKEIVEVATTIPMFQQASQALTNVIQTPISPELVPSEQDELQQKTEDILGPYEVHDFFLFHFLRYGAPPNKILWLAEQSFKNKYNADQLTQWLKIFIKRFFSQQFKRSCIPDGPKVGSVSLSPRSDWRMPSDADMEGWSNN
jgi:NAD+ synthase (glutamine-hydrolysing)